MAKRSGVTGADEIAADLDQVGRDLHNLGQTLADVAVAAAQKRAPTLAQLAPSINANGAILNYSGVITPAAFEAHIGEDLANTATDAVEHEIDAATQRAGLT